MSTSNGIANPGTQDHQDVAAITSSDQAQAGLPVLGIPDNLSRLTALASARVVGVFANPRTLHKAGPAVPLLALVNDRCGDTTACMIKYKDVAEELGVSVTTVKDWAEALSKLGYFTRAACGPSGVAIRLCPERWPIADPDMTTAVSRVVDVLNALRMTIDGVLVSAISEVRKIVSVSPSTP